MKLTIFAKKDLNAALITKFGDDLVISWDRVAEFVMEWTQKRQIREEEEFLDNWYNNLPKDVKLSMAENLWYDLTLEEKQAEYSGGA